jgi:hypothetical protein
MALVALSTRYTGTSELRPGLSYWLVTRLSSEVKRVESVDSRFENKNHEHEYSRHQHGELLKHDLGLTNNALVDTLRGFRSGIRGIKLPGQSTHLLLLGYPPAKVRLYARKSE